MPKKRRGRGSETHSEASDEPYHPKSNGSSKTEEDSSARLSEKTITAKNKNWRNMIQRTIWTFIMIGGFFAAIAAGHVWVIILVVAIQTMVYKEVIALGVPSKEQKLPWFRTLNWFLLPVSLVICNDIFAYVCGKLFGKKIFGNRMLLQLSPNKTFEGFVGAWICTIIFGLLWASLLMRWNYMICPVKDLSANVFTGLQCDINPVFIPQQYALKPWLTGLFRRVTHSDIRSVWIAPLQWHVFVMACFASSIAPFGGYFASGLKRALGRKDWGDSIPGHGGMTDRMDCQFLMGMFSFMYYQSFIKTYAHKCISISTGSILELVVNDLQSSSQLELYHNLKQYLDGQGLLDE
ncbi:11682_t:CDS:2 [Ambispora gerdemannii]|uniref:Phosphatidate cytidylyltransferase n=1 Tax=Ambispora gerdemannii TaxID=144530 RepID=A0A9N8VUT5_9GLOM|nr:11682_t:CDS:2 [Ambispora gerdemannii]